MPSKSSPAVNLHLRSALVSDEPLKFRTPFFSILQKMPPPPDKQVTLAVALVPLIEAIKKGQVKGLSVDALQNAIDICHHNAKDFKEFQKEGQASPLTVAGVAAINLYTGEFIPPQFYSVLNTSLRDENREACKPFIDYIWLLMHALRDCPRYSQKVVFRGVKADLSAHYPKDRELTWCQFSSCTCDLSVEQSEQFCGSKGVRTLFVIELTTGRARLISQYSLVPSEAEVLLPPNSRFKVQGVVHLGEDLTQIQLVELPCLDPILDFGGVIPSTDTSLVPISLAASSTTPAALPDMSSISSTSASSASKILKCPCHCCRCDDHSPCACVIRPPEDLTFHWLLAPITAFFAVDFIYIFCSRLCWIMCSCGGDFLKRRDKSVRFCRCKKYHPFSCYDCEQTFFAGTINPGACIGCCCGCWPLIGWLLYLTAFLYRWLVLLIALPFSVFLSVAKMIRYYCGNETTASFNRIYNPFVLLASSIHWLWRAVCCSRSCFCLARQPCGPDCNVTHNHLLSVCLVCGQKHEDHTCADGRRGSFAWNMEEGDRACDVC
jgi:hypothetical protein